MPRADGTDISSWQGRIDWPAVLATGIQWIGMRATVGGRVDTEFARNRAGAAPARCRLLYDYLYPGHSADAFIQAVGQLQVGEVAMLDAERDGITEADCLRWLGQVEAWSGRPAAVYTGGYVAGGTIWKSGRIFDGRRPRIFAAYSSEDSARRIHAAGIPWDAWQWTSTGSLPGISGGIDLDQVDRWELFDAAAGRGSNNTCLFGYPCPWHRG